MAARHFKYTYNSEIPPKTILSKMLKTNIDDNYLDNSEPNKIDLNIERNRIYFSRRKELKSLMKSVNSHIDNNSQSLFLTLYYMDIIFTHKDLEKVFYSHFYIYNSYESPNNIQMNDYALLSLACLIIASKFNENDPHVPTISSYIRLLFGYSKRKYSFSLYSLYMAEVVVLKLLKYKLNYYTIYHYLIYFFTHGIILKKTIENSKIFKKYSERKILEKIYIQAREILDGLIDSEKYFKYYFGKDNYQVVIEILLWSIEHVMNIKLKDDENIFKLVFNLNIEENVHKEIYEIIDEIYKNIKRKNNFGNKSTRIVPFSSTSSKTSTNYKKEPEYSSAVISNKSQSSEINFNSIEPKYSVPSSSSYTTTKLLYPSEPKDANKTETKDFQLYNGLIHNELERFNFHYPYNYQHSRHIQNQSISKKHSFLTQSNISYGPNNRIYLTSNKNITSNYQINSSENNAPKIFNSIKEANITSFQIDKEPIDSDKNFNLNYNNINNIDNTQRKIILINDSEKVRKKSLSCSKNIYNYNVPYNYNHQVRTITGINNNLERVKLGENIKKTKIPDSSKEINNFCNIYSPNNQNEKKEKNIENLKKESFSKNFKLANNNANFFPNRSYNPSFLNDKIEPKFSSGGEYINRTKNIFDVTKINQNLELEPKDNNRRSSNNKYYIDSGMKANINKSYNNKPNTIIINNNIHINTFIDKNNINLNQKGISVGNNNKNLFLYNRTSEKNVNEIYNEPDFTSKFKNIRIKQKNGSDLKNSINKINKSSIVFSNNLENNE